MELYKYIPNVVRDPYRHEQACSRYMDGCYRAPSSLGMFKITAYSDSCSVFTCSSRAREYWRSDSRSAWSFFTRVSRRMISNLSFCTSMLAAGEAAAGRDGGAGASAGRAAATAGAAAAG